MELLAMRSEGNAFGFGLLLVIMGIVFFFKGFKSLKMKKLIEGTPTSKVRSIAMGLAEMYGEVVPVSKKIVLKSPLNAKDCVYYLCTVEEYIRGKRGGRWVRVKSIKKAVEFFLKDETGKILVDSNGAEIEIPHDYRVQSRGLLPKDLSPRAQEFLKTHGVSQKGILGFNKELRITEYVIELGNMLYVMGNAGDNPFIDEGDSAQGTADVMIQRGGPIFYISDKPEKEILSNLGFYSTWGTLGGALAILAGLALIFLYMRML